MRVFSLSALLGLLLTGLAADKTASEDAEFKAFADRFGKKYSSEKELAFRYAIYKKNLMILTPDPVKYDKKGRPLLGSAAPPLNYRSEVNDFADMTDEEFRSYYLLSKETLYKQTRGQMEAIAELNNRSRRVHNARLLQQVEETVRKLPRKVDWNAQGFITPPKNQSRCNSCWAFSTVGVLEAFNKKNGGKELLFSEQ